MPMIVETSRVDDNDFEGERAVFRDQGLMERYWMFRFAPVRTAFCLKTQLRAMMQAGEAGK